MTASAVRFQAAFTPIVHRLAVLLTIAVFPLIWVGGLVTTYDAGMAVPDWPGTYGWNMFAYPISTWLFGPFDLLVEHSHRLLGSLAGFFSIGLAMAAWKYEERSWFRWWCIGILLAVVAQGALGGARVLLDQRTFAMLHGCTGPLFFALAAATATMSSRWWVEGAAVDIRNSGGTKGRLRWLSGLILIASYGQLVLGAQLRHVTGAVSHQTFLIFVHSHFTLAAVVLLLAILQGLIGSFSGRLPTRVAHPTKWLVGIVFLQVALGIGTWIVNYALPWQELNGWLAKYVIVSKGYWESMIVTAHMATGSLIISLATVVTFRAWRAAKVSNAAN
ncbi:MAG: COX15/CtaA family protein [Planctomycetales bacterium]|nr:COX15/CtaA family protein [Planctomycetales bacterium]